MSSFLDSLAPWAMTAILLVLKVSLVLLLAGLLSAALRQVSAGFRHLVWSAAIIAIIALPVLALAPWRMPVAVLPAAAVSNLPVEPEFVPAHSSRLVEGQGSKVEAARTTLDSRPSTLDPRPLDQVTPDPRTPWSLRDKLLAIWLAGMLLVAARLGLGTWLVRRLVRSATPLDTPEWRRPLVDVADRLSLPRLPELYLSSRLPMPFACGLFRTAIVLPAEAAGWNQRRREAVLCHELAHLRRKDLAINILAQCAVALYWFHPLVWVAARRIRIESERACDDLVLGTGTRASDYADHLLEIVRAVPRSAVPVAVLPFAERGEFEGRVLAILERGARRDPASRRGAIMAALGGVLLVTPLASLAPVRKATPAAPPAEPWPAQMIAPLVPRATPRPQPPAEPAPARSRSDREDRVDSASRVAIAQPAVSPSLQIGGAAPDTGSKVISSLIEALNDAVPEVRQNAAYSLGRLNAGSATAALGRMVERDASTSAREMAAWALGQIGRAEAAIALGNAAQKDTSSQVRATAVWALAQLDSPGAIPPLTVALRDRVTEVRARAAWAIGSISPDKAPPQLIEATNDTTVTVRKRAAWALGQIQDQSAASALSRLVQDPSGEVRDAALWALGNMDGEDAQAALIKALTTGDSTMRAQAARSLGGRQGRPWPWPWPMPR